MPSHWDPPMKMIAPPQFEPLPRHPWIALTFDDGPHPVLTERLLDILRREHVPATFFVVGKMANRYPELVQDIARDGNEVANHTYTHPNLAHLTDEEVLNELAQTRQLIRRLTGQDCCLFRPPGGAYSRETVRATAHAGYRMVLWSIVTKDVGGAPRPIMRRRILEGAEDGSIVLMHSGVRTTMDILPDVITKLRAEGYSFVTVSTLLGLSRPKPYMPDIPIVQRIPVDPLPTLQSAKATSTEGE